MRKVAYCFWVILFALILIPIAKTDTITLKNGDVIDGKVTSEEKDAKGSLVLETFNGNITIKKADILKRGRGKGKYENY